MVLQDLKESTYGNPPTACESTTATDSTLQDDDERTHRQRAAGAPADTAGEPADGVRKTITDYPRSR